MANTKTTGLTSLTGALSATDDVFFVVDVSDTTMAPSGTSKKMTRAELGIAVTAAHAASPPAGAFTDLTTTGNTILGDAATDTLNVGNGGLVKTTAGNVLIGTTTDDGVRKLQVNGGLKILGGNANAPTLTFATDPTSGFYQDSGAIVRVAVSGVRIASFVPNGLQLVAGATSASAPSLSIDNGGITGFFNPGSGVIGFASNGTEVARTNSTGLVITGTVATSGYTVATLPAAGIAGRRAYVTDATSPTFLGTLTGGGAVKTPVFDNGVAWVAG